MKVKICGITNQEDAQMCERLGADALGLVHFPGRSRSMSLDSISEIMSTIGPFTKKVLVSDPRSVDEASSMVDKTGADLLQAYNLSVNQIEELDEIDVKVLRVVYPIRSEAMEFARCAKGLVFENGEPGTGTGYDYGAIPLDVCAVTIIAGGLNLANLDKVLGLSPYGVDVSSGVESVPCRKDPSLVKEFIRRCHS